MAAALGSVVGEGFGALNDAGDWKGERMSSLKKRPGDSSWSAELKYKSAPCIEFTMSESKFRGESRCGRDAGNGSGAEFMVNEIRAPGSSQERASRR